MSKRRFSVAAASRPLHRGLYQAQEPASAVLPTRPRPHSLLRQGKHVGRTFEDVAKEDRSYVEWTLREGRSGELSPNLAAFAQYVKTEFGGLMTVGKHKDRYFSELLDADPGYADWCRTAATGGNVLSEFADYAARARTSNTRNDDDDHGKSFGKSCMFCLEKPVNAAWIPCGHTVSCYECARHMEGRCPICRQSGTVQRLFVG